MQPFGVFSRRSISKLASTSLNKFNQLKENNMMSIMKKIPAAMMIAGLLTSASFADAAGTDNAGAAGKTTFTVRGGFMDTSLKHNLTSTKAADGTSGTLSMKNGAAVEMAVTHFFTDNIALEGSLGYGVAKYKLDAKKVKVGKTSTTTEHATYTVIPLTALAQYHFTPTSSFSPYVGAGYSHQFTSKDFKDGGAFVAQVGVNVPTGDATSFNFDVKHTLQTKHEKTVKFLDSKKIDAKIKTTTIMAGVTFAF